MRRIYLAAAIVIITGFCFGCAGIQVNQQVEDVALKSAARIAGYEFATKNKDLAGQALPIAKAILSAANNDAPDTGDLLKSSAKLLTGKIGDPIIAASISDVVSLIKYQGADVSLSMQNAEIKAALEGFIEGISLAVGK